MRTVVLLVLVVLAPTPGAAQDTLTVVANGSPVWGSSPTLVEELRIGSLDGDQDSAFGDLVGIAVLNDGTIWVADAQNAEVRRFGRDGSFLGLVAARGEGPGELGGVSGIKVMPDGRVVVFDAHLSRLNFFAPDGSFAGSVSRSGPMQVVGASSAEVFQVTRTGVAYLLAIRARPRDDPGPARGVWLELDSDGFIVDSLAVPPSGRTTIGGRRYPFGMMESFTPVTKSALSPEGYLVTGNTADYALYRPLRDGRVLKVERPWDPVRVKRPERGQYRARAAAFAQRWDPAYGLGSDIPSSKPPWWAFRIDEQGRFWVARHTEGVFIPESSDEKTRREQIGNPPAEWWEPLVVDVLEPEGRYLGTLRFGAFRTSVAAARDDRIWTIELGEFDEPYVVRYRVRPGD